MADPLGLISASGSINRPVPRAATGADGQHNGPGFKALLQEQLQQVNELQQGATEAVEDLATGKRDDVEGVILATQRAETAFNMLLQVRNKVMDAYEEVKQIRV